MSARPGSSDSRLLMNASIQAWLSCEASTSASVHPDGMSPDPEVPERPQRRRYSTAYKLQILEEADRATEPGEIGALLRREGLYSSLLASWRQQRRDGTLHGAQPKLGRKGKDPLEQQNQELRKENARLARRLDQAETIIAVQKNSRACWGSRPRPTRTPRDS